ncbi:MAG: hypothetical protein ACRD4V_13370 [Candidatus Acidiferrales bacterium]
MTCAEFDSIVHDLARPNVLDKPATVMAKFHAQTCERCAARLAQAQMLAGALGTVADDSANLGAPAHLEPVLVSAFREHHRGLERTRHRVRRARWQRLEWSALAAAAAVLLVIGAWNLSRPRMNGVETAGGVTDVSRQAQTNSAAESAQSQENAAGTAQSDATADFVPVPYGEAFEPGDSGVIVRVEMPRSALADLGYSVDATRSADLVQADLLVGEDGWPRAVRLVP